MRRHPAAGGDCTVGSVEGRESWIVASAVLALTTVAFGCAWITPVALTEIAKDMGGVRTVPALAGSIAWLGAGIGGILMGRMYRSFGARTIVICGALMLAAGLAISSLGASTPLLIGHGLFIGMLGIGAVNAPMYIYISQWFDKRRGSALALISSGSYLAGALWPPVFERSIASFGWRQTMLMYGVVVLVVVTAIAVVFLKMPPAAGAESGESSGTASRYRVRLSPNVAFAVLCAGAVLCCIPMAMPQQHMVAFCGDLGISRMTGAFLLSVLLGTAFVSRQVGGWVSDKLGGLRTIFICSGAQAIALAAFLFTETEAGLFLVAGAFGLGFSPIVPAYALAVRELFDVREAYWRIPTILFFTASGMAIGGWLAGLLYDMFGSYQVAFATGVAANIGNFALIGVLAWRQTIERPIAA